VWDRKALEKELVPLFEASRVHAKFTREKDQIGFARGNQLIGLLQFGNESQSSCQYRGLSTNGHGKRDLIKRSHRYFHMREKGSA